MVRMEAIREAENEAAGANGTEAAREEAAARDDADADRPPDA